MMTNEEGEVVRKALRDAPSGTVILGATIIPDERNPEGGFSPRIRVIEDAMQAFEDYSCFIDTLTPETTQEEAQPGDLMFERAAYMLKKALELRGLRVRAFASVAAAAAGTSLPPKRLNPPETAR